MNAFDHVYEYKFSTKKTSCVCGWSERVEDSDVAYRAFRAHVKAESKKVPA